MPASIAAPNPENYVVGKGKVYFQPAGSPGAIEDYAVGNVTEWELTPDVEKLDHFSSMVGIKTKDKSITLSRGYAVRMVMEEWTPANMRMMLAGNPDVTNPAAVTIQIGSESNVTGRLKFVGSNDVGPKWTFDLPTVQFNPTGSLNPISDEWGNMEVTGEVLADNAGIFGQATSDFSGETAVPAATVPPTIYGDFTVGGVVHGVKGTWSGSPTGYTTKWQRDPGTGFVDIVGATSADYTIAAPVAAGDKLRYQVVATNTVGASAPANSVGVVVA